MKLGRRLAVLLLVGLAIVFLSSCARTTAQLPPGYGNGVFTTPPPLEASGIIAVGGSGNIVASTAITTTPQPYTVATASSGGMVGGGVAADAGGGGTPIWIGSNSTATIYVDIEYSPISN